MTVLFPSLSDATAGISTLHYVLCKDKMSSSHIPEELISRVCLPDYLTFGCECTISEVSSRTKIPVNVVPDDLLNVMCMAGDWQN